MDNINVPQPTIQEKDKDPKSPLPTTPQGTQTISEPLKLTTSTQTRTPRSKIHYQAKHGSSITKKRWSSRKVTTSSRVSFFCTVVLHQRSNRPRSTVILELKNTTPQTRLHPPTTPSSQTTTYGLNKNRALENDKQGLATNTNNADETLQRKEDATKYSPPDSRIKNLDSPHKETKKKLEPPPCNQRDSSKRRKPMPKAQSTNCMKPRHIKNPSGALTKRRNRECEPQHPTPHDTTPRISNLAKGLAVAITLLTARYTSPSPKKVRSLVTNN